MTDDSRRRRRGRRRGPPPEDQGATQPEGGQPPGDETPPEPVTETTGGEPAEASSRFGFLRRGKGAPKKAPAGRPAASTSPMDFWRTGQARSHRAPATARRALTLRQRITGFHFPAWSPVAFIMVLVLGILLVIVYLRGATGDPRIGDHNHAAYTVYVCGERQRPIREFEDSQGIHTHGDGMVHMHPFNTSAEGPGAALRKFFEYGAGVLAKDQVRLPGSRESFKAGENDCDGQAAEVRVLRADSGIHPLSGAQIGSSFSDAINECNSKTESEYEVVSERYVPKDGDCIRIIFGPPKVEPVVGLDHTKIDPSQATRTIDVDVAGSGADTVFTPESLNVSAGETVKVLLHHKSGANHGMRFNGPDRTYATPDDYVTDPPTIHADDPGTPDADEGLATAVIRFDDTGEYEFRDESEAEDPATTKTGKVTVAEATEASPTPEPTAAPETVDVEVEVAISASAFSPAEITLPAGKKFRLKLTNSDSFIHNLRIAGADGVYGTSIMPGDDLVSADMAGGGTGELVGQIDTPGTYQFRCDYHRTVHFGTIKVE